MPLMLAFALGVAAGAAIAAGAVCVAEWRRESRSQARARSARLDPWRLDQ